MLSNYKKLIASLNNEITLTPREARLAITASASCAVACAMTGMVIGMLLSPRKNMTIGSYNGCNNDCSTPAAESGLEAPSKGSEE